VEVHVRNDDREKAMEFKTWNANDGPGDPLAALLFNPADECLEPAPTTATPGIRAAAIRVNPSETATQELAFLVPQGNQVDYRLMLPYAAIGRRGQIGFEIPGIMIKTLPEEEEATQIASEGTTNTPTEQEVPQEPTETTIGPDDKIPAVESVGEQEDPFDMDVLRRSIEETAGAGGEDGDVQGEGAGDTGGEGREPDRVEGELPKAD
jgi:hypothetical protein